MLQDGYSVTAAAVAKSFSVPNTSRGGDDVIVVVSEVIDSSESVLVCILHNNIMYVVN